MKAGEERPVNQQRERDFFLHVLGDFCQGNQTVQLDSIPDISVVAAIAQEQSLGSLVYSQCRGWIRFQPGGSALYKAFLDDAFLSVNRADVLRDITEAFSENGIQAVFLKGAILRDYYPEPALRSMGDIDLAIRLEDREKSDRIMTEQLGFRKYVDNHDVWTYIQEPFILELHSRMFYENLIAKINYQAYFDRVWEHCRKAPVFGVSSDIVYAPDGMFHLLYLIAHTAKHIINSGNGFRAYLDMVMTVKALGNALDTEVLETELKKLELFEFTKTCFSLCERWFGVEMPFEKESLEERFYQEATDKTFADGIFGLENISNIIAGVAKDIMYDPDSYGKAAIKRGVKRLFPSYSDMQLIPWYSFVDGKPYLLPVAWLYRFGYCTVHKLKHSVQYLAQPFAAKKEVSERQSFLRQWGF